MIFSELIPNPLSLDLSTVVVGVWYPSGAWKRLGGVKEDV